MISKVKQEYYKVYGENLYLGTGGLYTVIFRYNFSYMISVWDFQERVLSMRIPRNLVTSTFSICLTSISILKCRSALLLLCLSLNIMKLVLSIFRDSLFSLNQLEIFFNSF